MTNAERSKRWREDNPDRVRSHARRKHLERAFGITPETYDEMFRKQNGLCAICNRPETAKRSGRVKRLAVDHNHETWEVRALLCQACNTAIGVFEGLDLFGPALTYLHRFGSAVKRLGSIPIAGI